MTANDATMGSTMISACMDGEGSAALACVGFSGDGDACNGGGGGGEGDGGGECAHQGNASTLGQQRA